MGKQVVEIDVNRKIDGKVVHNRAMCEKCRFGLIYKGQGYLESKSFCNYASVTGETALKKVGDNVVNLRGTDPNNCNLFENRKGKQGDEQKQRIKKSLY